MHNELAFQRSASMLSIIITVCQKETEDDYKLSCAAIVFALQGKAMFKY